MEDTVYDSSTGQLLSASLMDYAMPRAEHAPDFLFETRNVPCKTNPLGVKGAGEAGAICSGPGEIEWGRGGALVGLSGGGGRKAGPPARGWGEATKRQNTGVVY